MIQYIVIYYHNVLFYIMTNILIFFLYIDRSYIIKYIFVPLGLDLFQFNVNALCSKKYFVLILFARIKFFSSIFSMTSV